MIRFVIENGNNWLKFDMPTCELADHLGSIGICKDISIGGTENISVDYYPTEVDDEIANNPRNRKAPIFRTVLMTRMPMRTKNSMRIRTREWVWQWGCRGRKCCLTDKDERL